MQPTVKQSLPVRIVEDARIIGVPPEWLSDGLGEMKDATEREIDDFLRSQIPGSLSHEN